MNGLRNNFAGLYDYYYRFRWGLEENEIPSSAQHQAMAQHYRMQIEQALREFNNTLPNDVYEALAWVGLKNTIVWDNLSPQKKIQYEAIRNNFIQNNPPCQ